MGLKRFLVLLLAFSLVFYVTSLAEGVQVYVGKKIEGQFPVSLNGERVEQPGLVIEGVSYLPVRVIGEMMECEVSFIDREIILNCDNEKEEENLLEDKETPTEEENGEGEKMKIGDDLKFVDVPDERMYKMLENETEYLETLRKMIEAEKQKPNPREEVLESLEKRYMESEQQISDIQEELNRRQQAQTTP